MTNASSDDVLFMDINKWMTLYLTLDTHEHSQELRHLKSQMAMVSKEHILLTSYICKYWNSCFYE